MKIQKYQRGGLLRLGSGLLDAAEFIPVVGDILGMGRSALKGDLAGIGLSAAGLIPGVGNAATATKAARKGVKAIAHGADAARVAKSADAARAVKPSSIGWFKKPSGPRPGTFADEIDDVKDVVFTKAPREMVVRNPNLPVPSKAGGLATTVHRPDLPMEGGRVTTIGPGKGNDWRKYLEQNGWKYGAGAAALLGLGLLNRDNGEVPSEVAPITDGGEIVPPVVPVEPVQPVQPATPVYVPIESGSKTENTPVETVKPENKTEQSSDKPSQQTNNTSNTPVILEPAQPEVTVISNRLAKRLDKYNRVNRYGNFIKGLQEEHPNSRYLDRVERRADRKEERAYNRLSKTAAKQGVNFGTNQDEFAYIKPATPTYVGPYVKK